MLKRLRLVARAIAITFAAIFHLMLRGVRRARMLAALEAAVALQDEHEAEHPTAYYKSLRHERIVFVARETLRRRGIFTTKERLLKLLRELD